MRHYGPQGRRRRGPRDTDRRVFVERYAPPPQMWIFGAVDFTAALAKVAKVLGYRVTVCDAREVFATRRRFPMADEVVVDWPAPLFERARRPRSARATPCASSPTTPSSTCRRSQGALRHRRRLHRRDGQPHDARQADWSASPRRRHRRRPRPPDVADRPRHRRAVGGEDDVVLDRSHGSSVTGPTLGPSRAGPTKRCDLERARQGRSGRPSSVRSPRSRAGSVSSSPTPSRA